MNNEFERMWKEAVMARIEIILWYFSTGAEENHKIPQ
jgi:hypothetical protein